MSEEPPKPKWTYDAGEPWARKKHGWEKPHAGFRFVRYGKKSMPVGKCPSTIRTKEQAQGLLNQLGFPYWDSPDGETAALEPSRIYGVYDGVPYETRKAGVTFHAFPILPGRWDKIPESVRSQLVAKMVVAGATIDEWLKRKAE